MFRRLPLWIELQAHGGNPGPKRLLGNLLSGVRDGCAAGLPLEPAVDGRQDRRFPERIGSAGQAEEENQRGRSQRS